MLNFSPKIEDATDNQLKHWINESSPQYGQLASEELTRRELSSLQQTIKIFNKKSSKQSNKMILLTWVIALLTVVMVVGLFVQIWLVFK